MRLEGDPKLYFDGAISDLKNEGGQPVMDSGLENALLISAFTDPGYWGNSIAKSGEEIGSGVGELLRSPLTSKTRLDIEESIKESLAWMIRDQVATKINVRAVISGSGVLKVLIEVERKDEKSVYGYEINWEALCRPE